ncbi:hypothetical protein DMU97_21560 [Salmonella enterica subsp. enterica serovar Penarth]|nr:hypothetical protein [Salmonella enterica subsp. enterica serovar Penarth]
MICFIENLKLKKTFLLILVLNILSLYVILFCENGDFIYDATINLSIFILSSSFILSPLLIFAKKR